jgi:hypothetical protein
MKRQKGSTRADTLTAIIVITLVITTSLMAIVPSLNKAKAAHLRAICANNMKQMAMATATYAGAYDGMMPWWGGYGPDYEGYFRSSTNNDNERHPWLAARLDGSYSDPNGNPYPMGLGCLYASGIVNDARIFYCPAYDKDPLYKYESYTDPAPPNTSYEWGTLPQNINVVGNQWVRTSYSTFPIDTSVPKTGDRYQWTARKFDGVTADSPMMSDRLWNNTASEGMEDLPHREENIYAFNAAFKDGHVVYVKGPATTDAQNKTAFYKPWWDYYGMIMGSSSATTYEFYSRIYEIIEP